LAQRQREQISDPALAEARFLTASDQGAFVTANKDRIVDLKTTVSTTASSNS